MRQNHGAADHLVGMLGIDTQAQCDFYGLVKFCELHFLQERHCVLQDVGPLFYGCVRLGDILSFFSTHLLFLVSHR